MTESISEDENQQKVRGQSIYQWVRLETRDNIKIPPNSVPSPDRICQGAAGISVVLPTLNSWHLELKRGKRPMCRGVQEDGDGAEGRGEGSVYLPVLLFFFPRPIIP